MKPLIIDYPEKGSVMERIELNKVFSITKGKRTVRWKIVMHPYFPESFAVVSDHVGLKNGGCAAGDMAHIGAGGKSLEEAYETAYQCT